VTQIFYIQSNRDNIMAFGDFTVTRASTKNILGSAGLYVSVANNVPAFEFNTDGSYRGLLVEPGATNLALHSQAFDDAYWTKTNATITANSTVAPDGTTTADTVTTAGGLLGDVTRSFTIANDSLTRAFSIFIKKETVSSFGVIILRQTGGTARNTGIQFNKQTGVAQYVGNGFGAGYAAPIAFSVADAGQFWRISVSIDNNSTGNTTFVTTTYPNYGTSFGNFTAVDGTAVIWQAQFETGSVATSPIVTVASTVARSADSVTLASASSLIGQSEGSLFVELEPKLNISTDGFLLQLRDQVTANTDVRVFFRSTASADVNKLAYQVRYNNATALFGGNTIALTQTVHKFAAAYKVSDHAFYLNGLLSASSTSATALAWDLSKINLGQAEAGTNQFNGWIRSVALFPTRLANATLASITTL